MAERFASFGLSVRDVWRKFIFGYFFPKLTMLFKLEKPVETNIFFLVFIAFLISWAS